MVLRASDTPELDAAAEACGGVVDNASVDAGGVVSDAGVSMLDALSPTGSAECWRFNYIFVSKKYNGIPNLNSTHLDLTDALGQVSLSTNVVRG
jgi:hypothetical protein